MTLAIDIIVEECHQKKLVQLLDMLQSMNIGFSFAGAFATFTPMADALWGYKIYKTIDGVRTDCDIMIYKKVGTEYYDICHDHPPFCFYGSKYQEKDVFPLKLYMFGEIAVFGPQDPNPYLNLVYPKWQTTAVIWNHSSNQKIIKPMAEINIPPQPAGPLLNLENLEYIADRFAHLPSKNVLPQFKKIVATKRHFGFFA